MGVEHSGLVHTPQPPFPRQPREPRSFSSLSLPAGVSAAAGGGGGERGERRRAERRTPGCRGRPGELRWREAPAHPLPHAPLPPSPPQLHGGSPPPLPLAAAPRWSFCPQAVSALVFSEEGGVRDSVSF